jgi:hypothetical protein
MADYTLFYYPYASFTDAQLPLLKVAALYFDKLVLLDPVGASWDTVGADYQAREAVRQLKDAGILEIVTPATVLAKYEDQIAAAVRQDMGDPEFLELCENQSRASGKQRWTLSLAKVPQDLQTDQTMRHLMGDFARDVASKTAYAADDYIEHIEALSSLPGNNQPIPYNLTERAATYRRYAESGQAYDESREGYRGDTVEYRYADFPLALGEAIMMNHALFAGLLHAGATPITDDPFHNLALTHKLQRTVKDPAIRQIVNDRARARQIKIETVATTTLTDAQLNLPVLNPQLPIEEVLKYRQKHKDALGQARETLGWMARRIENEPWSEDFARELERKMIPDIARNLIEARKARDAWLNSESGRLALSAARITVGAAVAVLALFAVPVTPVALATAGLSLVSGVAIPGAEWLLELREGKKSVQENGLHFLLGLTRT